MRTNSPGAFLLSALLHGAVIGLFILLAWLAQQKIQEAPKIFELVAGPGNDLGATAAPALGTPDGKIDFKLPAFTPAPAPRAETAPPPPSVPEPAVAAPVEVAPPRQTAPPVAATKAPNFARDVNRISNKRARRLEAEEKRRQEASARAETERQKKVSYEEFLREHGKSIDQNSARARGRTVEAPQLNTRGIIGGAAGGSSASTAGAGGKALTRAEQSMLDNYRSLIMQRAKQSYQAPPGVSDQLQVLVGFHVSAGGVLSGLQVLRSSGNADFDRAVIAAFQQIGALGPPPTGAGFDWSVIFKSVDASG